MIRFLEAARFSAYLATNLVRFASRWIIDVLAWILPLFLKGKLKGGLAKHDPSFVGTRQSFVMVIIHTKIHDPL